MKNLPKILMRRGWIRMAIFFQTCRMRLRPSESGARYLEFLRQVLAMQSLAALSDGVSDYKIVVINRSKDKDRLEFFSRNMRRLGLFFQRHEAFDALDPSANFVPYRDIIGERFCGETVFPRGTLGCFLSHFTAWQDFLDSDDTVRFFCEDDAFILASLPRNSKTLRLPPDADFVFFNQRMGERISWEFPILDEYHYVNVTKALEAQCIDGQPLGAPGLDGYLLTKRGAAKLVQKISLEKFSVDIDWFVLFSALSRNELKRVLETERSGCFEFYKSETGLQINAYVALPILVEQVEFPTTIRRSDTSSLISRSEIG